MTKVSKVYFSFSRVCDARHRCRRRRASAARLAGGYGGPGPVPGRGARRPARRPSGTAPPGRRSSLVRGRLRAGGARTVGAVRLAEARRGPVTGAGCRADGARRVRHLGAAGGRGDVDDDGQVDREPEVAAQRVADRAAQDPLDRVLGELARRGQQRGAVDEAERTGQAQERALLRRERPPRSRPRCRTRSAITRFHTCASRLADRPRPHPLGPRADRLRRRVSSAGPRRNHPQTCPHLCARTVRGRARASASRRPGCRRAG